MRPIRECWEYTGEVSKDQRPKDSLLNKEIQFEQAKPSSEVKINVDEIQKIIMNRRKENKFDNYIIKTEIKPKIHEEEDVENEHEENITHEEMIDLFWHVEKELSKIEDFGSSGIFGVEKENVEKIFESKNKKKKESKSNIKIMKNLKKSKNVKILSKK